MKSGAVIVAILVFSGVAAYGQAKKTPPPPKKPIKDVMERTHKEKGQLVFLVRDAESTTEDEKKLLAEYQRMETMKPPLGDEKVWKGRIAGAVSAITDVIAKKPGAVERVRNATDCKGCHEGHRVGGNK